MNTVRHLSNFALFIFSALLIGAQGLAADIYDREGNVSDWFTLVSGLNPGTVVVFADTHGFEPHYDNQREFLIKVSPAKFPISVGMEFFEYPQQRWVDDYLDGAINEADFLSAIKWSNAYPFRHYRFQVRLPAFRGGTTVALNCPRSITSKIATQGLGALTPDERAYLPPDFTLGRRSYFERFQEAMKDHVPAEVMGRYFAAHSAWDDTMAWQASQYMRRNPDHLLVIIVGGFHVDYMDGIVARLRARGLNDVMAISQISTTGMSDEERLNQLKPHPVYGYRADFLFETR